MSKLSHKLHAKAKLPPRSAPHLPPTIRPRPTASLLLLFYYYIIMIIRSAGSRNNQKFARSRTRNVQFVPVRPSGDSRATNRPEHIVQDFPSVGAVRCMRTRAFACDKSLLLLFFGYASNFFYRQFPGWCRICRALSSCVSFANVSGAEPFSLFRYITWPGCADGFTVPNARCPPDDIGR